MKKLGFLFILCYFIGTYSYAQMLDMVGSSMVQGKIATQSAKGTKTALNMIQQNKLIEQLNLLIMDIRTHSLGSYVNLDKRNFKYNFGSFDWNIGAINDNQFFIELKNIDKSSCNRLVNAISEAVTVKINSFVKKDCDDMNSIQFIFN